MDHGHQIPVHPISMLVFDELPVFLKHFVPFKNCCTAYDIISISRFDELKDPRRRFPKFKTKLHRVAFLEYGR